jgi:2-polyprenyl-3-methyl-5-hydroxy-6-metoxy-1,4-benzoquinol methylase
MLDNHNTEILNGDRFEFGANWSRFLCVLNDERIARAEKSLCEYLGVDGLAGKRFLDAGSGSGLFSLAARRLGAEVHSFDYDPQSVACTRELRNRYWTKTIYHGLVSLILFTVGEYCITRVQCGMH